MENFLPYLIKSSLIITGICLLYQLLRNDRNFTRNRIFLVSGMLAALLLPLIHFTPEQAPIAKGVVLLTPVTIGTQDVVRTAHQYPNAINLLLIVYLAGVVLLLTRTCIQLMQLFRLAHQSDRTAGQGYQLVLTNKPGSPFSFFKLIFINQQIEKQDAATILAHEQAHVRQWHSIDVLLMELLVILQWFNPVVWLYRSTLREVHEYLADRSTLNKGIAKAGYLQLLFATALKVQPVDITNSFCQIKLKRRLTMITKMRNARLTGLKFVFALSMLAMFVWLVSCDNSSKVNDEKTEVAPPPPPEPVKDANATQPGDSDDPVFTVVEEMPEYVGGDEARIKFLVANIKYPQVAKENGIQGTVYVSFVVNIDGSIGEVKVIRGIDRSCDEEAVRVVKMMPRWKPGKQSGKNVKVQFNMPIKFSLA